MHLTTVMWYVWNLTDWQKKNTASQNKVTYSLQRGYATLRGPNWDLFIFTRDDVFTVCLPVCLQAIARKLQEKEMKEERRRQKQLEANFEEEYFEDHGGGESTTDSC